jgi:hypothetical protein
MHLEVGASGISAVNYIYPLSHHSLKGPASVDLSRSYQYDEGKDSGKV